MHVNPRAYVSLENITWSELGKQSIQAKKVYSASYAGKTLVGHLKNIFYIQSYNGGQKCWDLSSDITKTSEPSPPTANKVEFGAKWK